MLRGSSVSVVIGYALWSDSRPEHPDWLWTVYGAFYPEIRRPEREAGAEIKNEWCYRPAGPAFSLVVCTENKVNFIAFPSHACRPRTC